DQLRNEIVRRAALAQLSLNFGVHIEQCSKWIGICTAADSSGKIVGVWRQDVDFRLSDEQRAMRALVREVAEREFRPRALDWEKSGEFPTANMKILGELGILGLSIPDEYGGAGGTWLDAALALEEIGRCCYVTAMAVLGEVGVQSQAIVSYGSEAQKRKYLPRIASGELMCANCITEPEAGSDAGSMTTRADEVDGHFVVNG